MDEDKICKEYIEGESNKELSLKHKVHRTTIQRVLKRNGVELRKQTETSRKHTLINFNNGILNYNDAYLLGLIFSDGNLTRNCIEIILHEKDKQILIVLSNYVYGYEKISYRKGRIWQVGDKTYKSGGQWRFRVNSKFVVNILKPIGLKENKSLTLEYPKIDSVFDRDFIRGYFDGDGSLCIPKIKGNVRISIVGSHMFCKTLKDKLTGYLESNITLKEKTNNVSCVEIYGRNQVLEFCNWLYTGCDLKMNRKYEKYKELLHS